jgi:hypothetical protein
VVLENVNQTLHVHETISMEVLIVIEAADAGLASDSYRIIHYVGEILPSAGGALCCKQVLTRNEVRPQTGFLVENVLNPARPCGVKLNARNCREDVDADRLAAHAEERAGFLKVGGGQTLQRRAEFSQGRENRPCVFRIGLHQDVEVFGGAGLRMDRYGIGANDKVLSAVRVQNGQEFCVV